MSRVLLANLAQETCSFARTKYGLDDFRRYYLYFGAEVLERLGAGGNEVGGIAAAAKEDGITLVPSLATYGGTGGPVETAAYTFLRDRILADAAREAPSLDGAILALHGAMATQDLDDPEGDLVSRLRALLGPDKPIFCSFDLHAHITEQIIANVDGLAAYHTHPHVDFFDTGHRAMKLLGRSLRGEIRPALAFHKVPMVAPAEHHNTSRQPMAEIMGRVLDIEKEPGVLAVSLFMAHPHLDVPNLGWTAVVMTDGDPALARAHAEALTELAWSRRQELRVRRMPIPEALARAREIPGGPVVLADASDATSSGADGDSTCLLKALLESPVPGPCFVTIVDPEAVAACAAAGPRAEVTIEVGGKLNPAFSRPVRVTGRVRTLSDGLYMMKLPPIPADRGRAAVLQVGDVSIVLSEKPVYMWDQECYRSVGLFPPEAKLVQVKSPGGFRPSYEGFAKEIIDVDAPGPTDSDLARLPYRKVTRPLFPLDNI
ncbi:MAG: M81 family metallopeptidase [Chloroflexota bacterium]